ncbi:MAG: hypothetical protein UT55_C0008G0016 [Candidatus Peregrinibacteria bacterium GW2011_GWE2_39_6]|nr:MAG: hypothetical protein UT36_C0002G0072 [Candidatus Peregrinibacteria bacterium GW2011_GWF2_39_17]KKR26425.1 MAG: hypothetical protein UT55_C0008G0016 [Candidatus Peregrinibacteria bacterium GW2011_GWE2_39_6]HCW32177.1 hypothetical protein [Candidatus Peregrinibacteria bacterium]
MPIITQLCRLSGKTFLINEEDQAYYQKIDVSLPTLCPAERQRRRLTFRNERNLYSRKCDLTGQQIISNYSPTKTFKVYDKDVWWSNQWDPFSYGRSYDFSKSFFEQFRELQKIVPRINLYSKGGENIAYTNHATYNKNCYMLFNATHCEDVHYSTNYIISSRDCIDCYSINHCELLYDSIFCENCHKSTNLVNCKNCRDSSFLYDCRGCESCLLCWNLRNKKYCLENKQYTKEEYEQKINQFDLGSYQTYQNFKNRFLKLVQNEAIHRATIIDQSENCTGNYLFSSKNTKDSFYAIACEDSKYIYDGYGHKDAYDCYESAFEAERQYECYACNYLKFSYGCHVSQEGYNLYYTDYCYNSNDLFGCIGLRRAKYCLLNKQYSKEDYLALKERIINQMKTDKQWGEFLPSEYSPFAYNESVAQDFMPLPKEEILKRGLQWFEAPIPNQINQKKFVIPDNIKVAPDTICNEILECKITHKPYKIIPPELKFYHKLNIPIPHKCFEQRHKERTYFRHPRTLYPRSCTCCHLNLNSPYEVSCHEKIYCENCYLKSVY